MTYNNNNNNDNNNNIISHLLQLSSSWPWPWPTWPNCSLCHSCCKMRRMRLEWCIIDHNFSDCWHDEWLDHNTAVAVGPTGSDFATWYEAGQLKFQFIKFRPNSLPDWSWTPSTTIYIFFKRVKLLLYWFWDTSASAQKPLTELGSGRLLIINILYP